MREHFFGTSFAELAVAQLALWLLPLWAYWEWQLPVVLAATALVSLVLALAHARYGWVTVDEHGVTVRTGLFAKWYAFEDIDRARRRTEVSEVRSRQTGTKGHVSVGYVELTLRNGDVVRLPATEPLELAKRILEGKYAAERGLGAESVDALARGGRSVSAWIGALRELTMDRAGYRAAPISKDALWNVLESRWLPEHERAAAAVALGTRAGPRARDRMLRIAEHTDSERLRIAIERAADETADEEALAESLAAVSREDDVQ